jgi:hypothetical protein
MDRARVLGRLDFYGFYSNKTAGLATVDEVYPAGYLGVERVILAPANVQTGLQPGAALTDDDRTAGDYLASENLYTQPLRIRIAAVLGTA